jgi:hypothetical protein
MVTMTMKEVDAKTTHPVSKSQHKAFGAKKKAAVLTFPVNTR